VVQRKYKSKKIEYKKERKNADADTELNITDYRAKHM